MREASACYEGGHQHAMREAISMQSAMMREAISMLCASAHPGAFQPLACAR